MWQWQSFLFACQLNCIFYCCKVRNIDTIHHMIQFTVQLHMKTTTQTVLRASEKMITNMNWDLDLSIQLSKVSVQLTDPLVELWVRRDYAPAMAPALPAVCIWNQLSMDSNASNITVWLFCSKSLGYFQLSFLWYIQFSTKFKAYRW